MRTLCSLSLALMMSIACGGTQPPVENADTPPDTSTTESASRHRPSDAEAEMCLEPPPAEVAPEPCDEESAN